MKRILLYFFLPQFLVCQNQWMLKSISEEPIFEIKQLFFGERFPNVVVAVDGSIIASYGQTKFMIRRSEDGGKTWGPVIKVADGIHGGGLTVDEQKGDIIAFIEAEHPPSKLKTFRSKDNAKSWESFAIKIKPDKNGIIPSMHMNEHGITLKKGKYKGRLIRASRNYNVENSSQRKLMYSNAKEKMWKDQYTNAIYSDDGGKTWQTSDPFPAKGTGEAAIVELSDGTIYYNSRRHFSSDGLNPRMRHIATSTNGGQNWENLYVSTELPDGEQNRDYGLMAGLDRFSFKGYDILIYSNIVSDGGRKNGTIWLSFDAGKSWPVKKVIEPLGFKYSSLAIGKENTPSEGYVYLLYETGEGENINAYGGGKIARFNLSWILEGKNINQYFN